jgi:hypothetical protein
MAKRTVSATWVALATAGLVLGGALDASAGAHVKQALRATSHAPRARGNAKLTLKTSAKGVFSIAARRLAAATSYDVVVAGVKVGTVETNARGAGHIVFGAPKRGHRALLGFDPRGRSLAVRDHDGNDVLEGDMPDDATDPGKVACCLPDDDGVECDDRTPEHCLDDGGTPSSATGCFPDPCATTGTAVCCTVDSTCGAFVDDDPELGCHAGVTAAECAEHHGTLVDATSCEPNPCAPVPPVALVTCCVPEDDDEGMECEFRTADHCAAKGGTVNPAPSCDPNPCQVSSGDDHHGDGEHDGDVCEHHHHDGGDDQGDDNDDQGEDN